MSTPKLPSGGGSFVRQSDGSLKPAPKPSAKSAPKTGKPAKPTPKEG